MGGFDEAALTLAKITGVDSRSARRERAPRDRHEGGKDADTSGPEEGRKGARGKDDGHRDRLRARFLKAGADGIADYELLELILFRAIPRRDVKPLAKALLDRFGSVAEVLTAPAAHLAEAGLGPSAIIDFGIVKAAAQQLVRGGVTKRSVLDSWTAVTDYVRAQMAFVEREVFRVLLLDKRNTLIADEVMGTGTIDHAPVYPRELVKRALELSATAVILVHNHPSGDPTPSQQDVAMTQQIVALAKPLGITVHDHLIVGRHGVSSLRKLRMM